MSLWIGVLEGWYDHSINELDALIRACPEELWLKNLWEVKPTHRVVARLPAQRAAGGNHKRTQTYGACWNVAFHTVRALDAYLSPVVPFQPLMDLGEGSGPEEFSDVPYTKVQVLEYLKLCRNKLHETFASLTDEQAAQPRTDEPYASALVRGLMHLREHTGQLALFLGLEATG